MSRQSVAFVGIGSNLGEPEHQVALAIEALDGLSGTRVVATSSFYLNPPMGPTDQPHYVNAVAKLETGLEVDRLFAGLQRIEEDQRRERRRRWGPRTIDLDLLTYGDVQMDGPDLVLPHPGMIDRAFVLVPLAEIAPDAVIPGHGVAADLRDALPGNARDVLERITR